MPSVDEGSDPDGSTSASMTLTIASRTTLRIGENGVHGRWGGREGKGYKRVWATRYAQVAIEVHKAQASCDADTEGPVLHPLREQGAPVKRIEAGMRKQRLCFDETSLRGGGG